MKFQPKAVIFDLDGTLVEFPHDFLFQEAARILEELSHPVVERSHLEECFSSFDFFRFVEHADPQTFITSFWKLFNWDHFPTAVPFQASEALCRHFSDQGIRLAIATARVGKGSSILAELGPDGFAKHLTLVEARQEESQEWTDKRPQIERVCSALGVLPGEAMMIGDIPPDISSAKQAGLGYSVAVLSGGIKEEVLRAAEPDLLVDDIQALLERIS